MVGKGGDGGAGGPDLGPDGPRVGLDLHVSPPPLRP
jgi:hypothetical protein